MRSIFLLFLLNISICFFASSAERVTLRFSNLSLEEAERIQRNPEEWLRRWSSEHERTFRNYNEKEWYEWVGCCSRACPILAVLLSYSVFLHDLATTQCNINRGGYFDGTAPCGSGILFPTTDTRIKKIT